MQIINKTWQPLYVDHVSKKRIISPLSETTLTCNDTSRIKIKTFLGNTIFDRTLPTETTIIVTNSAIYVDNVVIVKFNLYSKKALLFALILLFLIIYLFTT